MISLKSSHLLIDSELVEKVFSNVEYTFAVYNNETGQLLLSPVTNQWLQKMYENTTQFFLKTKNANGDKAISLGDILIENDLDEVDRELEFEYIEKTNLLKIKL